MLSLYMHTKYGLNSLSLQNQQRLTKNAIIIITHFIWYSTTSTIVPGASYFYLKYTKRYVYTIRRILIFKKKCNNVKKIVV